MPRKRNLIERKPLLTLAGISEQQWKFLRLRAYDESDAQSAQALGISPRVVQGWKRRSDRFGALHSFALAQPRLFASGEFVWRETRLETPPANSRGKAVQKGSLPIGTLYPRESDAAFTKELRSRELALNPPSHQAPQVDLQVPEQHRKAALPPREPSPREARLAKVLGVEHCVVTWYWNGQPSKYEPTTYERDVDRVSQFIPGFQMESWYPDSVLGTSAGLVVVADGTLSQDVRCPAKTRGCCPLVGRKHVKGDRCPHWELAHGAWLDMALPDENTQPICHRDFGISRLLAYVAAATMRGFTGSWSAGLPVITFRDDAEKTYWAPRVERWNKLIRDPWHRIHLVDAEVIINAIVDFRVREELDAAKEQTNAR